MNMKYPRPTLWIGLGSRLLWSDSPFFLGCWNDAPEVSVERWLCEFLLGEQTLNYHTYLWTHSDTALRWKCHQNSAKNKKDTLFKQFSGGSVCITWCVVTFWWRRAHGRARLIWDEYLDRFINISRILKKQMFFAVKYVDFTASPLFESQEVVIEDDRTSEQPRYKNIWQQYSDNCGRAWQVLVSRT